MSSEKAFHDFVEQAIHTKDPQSLRLAATTLISKLPPEDYLRLLLDFLYQTQFSRNGITGLLCVPFTTSIDDGHDYPGKPFLLGSPGPLDELGSMEVAIGSIRSHINAHQKVN